MSNNALYYLATPYSKFEAGIGEAWVEACKLTARLISHGVTAYSPIAHTHPVAQWGDIDPFDHSIWLRFDLAMMTRCDALLVAHVQGWQESYGIAEEIKFFIRAGKPIFDLDPATLTMTARPFERPPRERYDGLSEDEHRARTNAYLGGEQLAHGNTPAEHGGGS